MQLWFMKRKAQVLNFWNEFSFPAKVPKVKNIKICINMIWKLKLEMHIIGIKASHFLFFMSHGMIMYFPVEKRLVIFSVPTLYHDPSFYFVLSMYWTGVYSYSSGLAKDIHRLMTRIVMLKVTGCPNDKYLNFLVCNHRTFCVRKFTHYYPQTLELGCW